MTTRSVRRYQEEGRLRAIVPAHETLYLRADVDLLALRRDTAPLIAHRAREACALAQERAEAV